MEKILLSAILNLYTEKVYLTHPIESHIAQVFKDIVVWMAEHFDISVTWAPFGTKLAQRMLGMGRITGQGLLDFLVDDHVDLDSCLCSPFEHLVEPPFLVEIRRPSEKQFRRQPPIRNVDGLCGSLKCYRNSPEVVACIDIPLDLVAFVLRRKGLKTVGFRYGTSLLVCSLLMLLVMAMVWIEYVS